MNTIETYLQKLLISQNLLPEQVRALQSNKAEVTEFLRAEFGNDPNIRYAGSHEKGTMIRDNYDLDIVCYFPSSDSRTLKQIREEVSTHLGKNYVIEPKASAERIIDLKGTSAPHGYHIDVVPGRVIEGTKDVFIHLADGEKERLKTNLKTHIDYIVNSGCVPVIRLVKIWANRNDVHLKTFILELFVIEALSGSTNKDNLQESFLKVMDTFKDKFDKIQLVDPANTNNIVSQTIDASYKMSVMSIAEDTFNSIDGSDDIYNWKAIFDEAAISSASSKAVSTSTPFTPSRPYSA